MIASIFLLIIIPKCIGNNVFTLILQDNDDEMIEYTCITNVDDYLDYEDENCKLVNENYHTINISNGEKSVDFLGSKLANEAPHFVKRLMHSWDQSVTDVSKIFNTSISDKTSALSVKYYNKNKIIQFLSNDTLKLTLKLTTDLERCRSSYCCWLINASEPWFHIEILIENSHLTLINGNGVKCKSKDPIEDSFKMVNDDGNDLGKWRYTKIKNFFVIENNFTTRIDNFKGCFSMPIWSEDCDVNFRLTNESNEVIFNKNVKFEAFNLQEIKYCNSKEQNLLLELNHTNSGVIYTYDTLVIKPKNNFQTLTCKTNKKSDVSCTTIFKKQKRVLDHFLEPIPYNNECGDVAQYCKSDCNITCGENLFNLKRMKKTENSVGTICVTSLIIFVTLTLILFKFKNKLKNIYQNRNDRAYRNPTKAEPDGVA